ncbi:MAG: thiamine pyrophosphate-binding protein [Thermaerobacterales bacterium]
MKVYQCVAQAVAKEGTEVIFGLMADDNLDILVELDDRWGVKFISARHEQGAVAMADGWSRSTGKVVVCTVGRGPAIAQTGTALVTARKRNTPMVLLLTTQPWSDRATTKWFEQEGFLKYTIGAVEALRSPETVAEDVRRVFRHARSGRGPVVLHMPKDILEADLPDSWQYEPVDVQPQRTAPDPERVEEAAVLLETTERPPVILAGRGAVESGAKQEIEALAERLGAFLGTTLLAKGYFEGHPYNLGVVGTYSTDKALEFLSTADCLLALGCSLNERTTHHGHTFPRARIIQVDHQPAVIGDRTEIDLGIAGDIKATVTALNRQLAADGVDRKARFWTPEIAEYLAGAGVIEGDYTYLEGRMDPREFVDTINNKLPDKRTVVVDSAHFVRFVIDGITIRSPDELIWTTDFSAIGLGLVMAIGNAVARPERRCVLFSGDSGFMMHAQELDTAVRFGLPMTMFIMNDNALGSEVRQMEKKGKPTHLAHSKNPQFAELARGFGAKGFTVRSVADIERHADEFFNADGPVVVDVKINRNVAHRLSL